MQNKQATAPQTPHSAHTLVNTFFAYLYANLIWSLMGSVEYNYHMVKYVAHIQLYAICSRCLRCLWASFSSPQPIKKTEIEIYRQWLNINTVYALFAIASKKEQKKKTTPSLRLRSCLVHHWKTILSNVSFLLFFIECHLCIWVHRHEYHDHLSRTSNVRRKTITFNDVSCL